MEHFPLKIHCLRDPIIILGMHRSGTTMVAELLDQLGLFVGANVQDDHEAVYFLDVNETLFKQVHAFWDNPLPVASFFNELDALEMTARCVREDLLSRRATEFLGWKRYLKYKSVARLDHPWGWKDPRTIFTLPLWLKLFPDAKIIHIVRNGVDVASSLRVREKKKLAERIRAFERKRTKRSKRSKLQTAGYKGSARCLALAGGFALWKEYLERAEENLRGLSNSMISVRYEDLLKEPRRHLRQLADFCALKFTDNAIDNAAANVNDTRANAFLGDAQVRSFYESVQTDPLMRKYEYSAIEPVPASV